MSKYQTNTRDLWKLISALDLADLTAFVAQEQGWAPNFAAEIEWEYRAYLYLTEIIHDVRIAPTLDIDELWHAHILDTEKYAQDCNAAFGNFRHHRPNHSGTPQYRNTEFSGEIVDILTARFGARGQRLAHKLSGGGVCSDLKLCGKEQAA